MTKQSLEFRTCISAYNFLREMAKQVEQAHGGQHDWRLLFENGLHGFAARLSTIVKSAELLDEPFAVPLERFTPQQWAIETDQRIGEILFGMDSALECFVFAINAIGCMKFPGDFCDISTEKGLKQIRPDNMLGAKPQPGYAHHFPRINTHWGNHRDLIETVFLYHDVSKHRSCVVDGSSPGAHGLPDQPKQPGGLKPLASQTVEKIAADFHAFCEGLMIETVEELSSVFGVVVDRTDYA